jgi:cytochrome P450
MLLGAPVVTALGPDATEAILVNKDKAFSQSGWTYFIGPFFRRGLMLLDFDEHRYHRRIMQDAFTAARMGDYLERMQPGLRDRIERWPPGPGFAWYAAVKQLMLATAADVFVGLELGEREAAVQRALLDTVRAGTAVVRFNLPGGRWHAGLRGRGVLEEFFRAAVPAKRASDDRDLFAALCRAHGEDGALFTDTDVVNHMIFLLMAAHDTTTIALTAVGYQLARHPPWQERVRAEVLALDRGHLQMTDLDALPTVDLVLKESMRLLSPVHVLARRTVTDTAVLGRHVPAGTLIQLSPWFTHWMPELWPEPARFDPDRFAPARREDRRHRYAWAPFGGGVHKCIGMGFATVQVKAALNQILRRFRWSVDPGYRVPIDTTALPVPADRLPVRLEPLR